MRRSGFGKKRETKITPDRAGVAEGTGAQLDIKENKVASRNFSFATVFEGTRCPECFASP